MAWTGVSRTLPAGMPSGQRAMKGTRVPPSYVEPFPARRGALSYSRKSGRNVGLSGLGLGRFLKASLSSMPPLSLRNRTRVFSGYQLMVSFDRVARINVRNHCWSLSWCVWGDSEQGGEVRMVQGWERSEWSPIRLQMWRGVFAIRCDLCMRADLAEWIFL